MSDYQPGDAPQETRNNPAVNVRHRRSGVRQDPQPERTFLGTAQPRGGAPFSRVSGAVRAASDESPTRENRPLPPRARVAYGEGEPVHRPVQAPGYREVEPLRTAKRAVAQTPRTVDRRPAEPPVKAPPPKRGRGLLIAVVVLLVLALVFLGLVLWKGWPPFGEKAAATEKATPTFPMNASATEGTVPYTVTFTVTTGTGAEWVRLVDGSSNPLEEQREYSESGNTRNWLLSHEFAKPYTGTVQAFAYNGENTLVGQTDPMQVAMRSPDATPAPATETPVPLSEPEDEAVPVTADEQIPEEEPEELETEVLSEEILRIEPEGIPEGEPEPGLEEPADETVTEPAPADTEAAQGAVVFTPVETAPPVSAETGAETDGTTVMVAEVVVETPVPEPTPAPTPTPVPARRIAPAAASGADPGLIKNVKVYDGKKKLTDYLRAEEDAVDMPDAENYLPREMGVFTFRGSSFRQNAAAGTVTNPSSLRVIWKQEASSVKDENKKVYYGVGAGSQPAIVQWATQIREMSGITDEKKAKAGLREVIVAGEDGRIYFFDLEDGEPTRKAINLGYPMRGTPSVNVKGRPFMMVGQYARKIPGSKYQIGMRCYNLLNSKEIYFFNGIDSDYKNTKRPYSGVGNFDTSALYDRNSDSILFAGGNGMLYLAKMSNNKLSQTTGEFSTDISYLVMATQANKEAAARTAVQSSLAAYQGYVFWADMGGYLRCVDANTLTVQWAVATGDAVESAVALDLDEDENLWLYTANTLRNRTKGDAQIRRYNAETGEESWTLAVNVTNPKKKNYTPGVVASPVIGRNGLSDFVYYTVSGLSATGGDAVFGQKEAVPGALLCVEKATGRVRWAYKLSSYSYSSPVAVYDAEGNGWIVQAASDGTISLLDGRTGSLIHSMQVEGTINGSPAVYNSTLVIGTQGKNTSFIYGIALE